MKYVICNVVRVEFLGGVVRPVTNRKHEGHIMVRKTLLKGKIITSHIYTHTQNKKYI
jgi:hypothetical protein